MRHAPPISYPVERSCLYAALLCFFSLLGGVSLVLWSWQSAALGWTHIFGFSVWLSAIFLAAYGWRTMPVGTILWNGTMWCFMHKNDSIEGTLTVYIDLQSSLLIHMKSQSRLSWIILEQSSAPSAWGNLRCALYARRRNVH